MSKMGTTDTRNTLITYVNKPWARIIILEQYLSWKGVVVDMEHFMMANSMAQLHLSIMKEI